MSVSFDDLLKVLVQIMDRAGDKNSPPSERLEDIANAAVIQLRRAGVLDHLDDFRE
jgi:hypothetical protein